MGAVNVNYVAVLAAAVAGWVFGLVWYRAFAVRWMDALGKTRAQLLPNGRRRGAAIALSFVAALIMAGALAYFITAVGPISIGSGLLTAAVCWFGFVLATVVVNTSYTGDRRALAVVASWHWLGVMLVMGVVIGAFG